MKKHATKKLRTTLEKIRTLVSTELTTINGGGTVPPEQQDTDTTDRTGCPIRTQ